MLDMEQIQMNAGSHVLFLCNWLNWDESRVEVKEVRGQEINGIASFIKLYKLEMSVGNYPFNLFWWTEYFIRPENYLKYHLVCHTYKLN